MLGFVKLRNVASGRVEVHWAALEGGRYKRAGSYTWDFSPANVNNGVWSISETRRWLRQI
jgi:hypothetical protein